MKKHIFWMAFFAILSFTFISCGDDNDSSESKSTVSLSEPKYKSDATKLIIPDNSIDINGEVKGNVKEIELTASGKYIASFEPEEFSPAKTRAGEMLNYIIGQFTKNADGSYELNGFGNITIHSKGASVSITLTPTGGKAVTLDVTVADKVKSSDITNYLCRTWTIENTRLHGTINGLKVAKDFPGKCNLFEVIEYAREKGAKIIDQVSDNCVIEDVIFTWSKSYIINYSDGQIDVGSWQWTSTDTDKGSFNYSWNSPYMGNSFETGTGMVEFAGNKCKLTLPTKITESNLEVVYTLK
jgi:hypothetical protein